LCLLLIIPYAPSTGTCSSVVSIGARLFTRLEGFKLLNGRLPLKSHMYLDSPRGHAVIPATGSRRSHAAFTPTGLGQDPIPTLGLERLLYGWGP
jgi:hypothetical protein